MVVVDTASATSFAKFSSTFGQVKYKPTAKNIGYYSLSCSFRDNSDYSKVGPTMKFKVQVISIPTTKNSSCPLGDNIEKCKPRITSISDTGVLTLGFPVGLQAINST
jgi:hypothetical protein